MKSLIAKAFAAAAITAVLSSAQASVVTVGSLTRDTAATTISDSLNNRTWLGWDVTKGLTYAQTLAAVGTGGQFAGYSVAHNSDAQMFVNALLGTNGCTVNSNATCAADLSAQATSQIGLVTGDSHQSASSTNRDYVWFLSDNSTGSDVGLIFSYAVTTGNVGSVQKQNEWSNIATANNWSSSGQYANVSIGWLLYRDGTATANNTSTSNDVPEPGTLALTGLALLAAMRLRRKA